MVSYRRKERLSKQIEDFRDQRARQFVHPRALYFPWHSVAAKVSVRMLPLVSWLPSNPNGSLICVDVEALRVTISVPRHTDLKAIKKDLTQISALQNMVVVLNVCGEGSRDFW